VEHERVHDLTAAYALHALRPDEERAFEAHLSRCSECRDELASFDDTTAALAYGVDAPPPPPALRERILAQARAERPNVRPLRPRWAAPAAVAGAVAAVAALALGLWAVSLSNELQSEREAQRDQPRAFPVAGTEGGRLVVAPTGEAVLLLPDFDPAPRGKTYEAWVIEDGAPQPAGLFEGGRRTAVALTRPVPRGAVVAVTLEPAGGVPAPTSDPLVTVEAT
jgi:anti-sigma-K factor RskA